MAAVLALTGHSLEDIEFVGGQWQMKGSGGGAGAGSAGAAGIGAAPPPPSADDAAALQKLEAQIRTLRVEPYTLLTADERKDQANRSKALAGSKRSAAYPGDPDEDAAEPSLNPFAAWPYEQRLKFEPSYSYSLCGRLLRNALSWCNRYFTDGLARMTWKTQLSTTAELYSSFSDAVATQRNDYALLLASHAVAEATAQMAAIISDAQANAFRFPQSKMLRHVVARREAQALELKIFLADVSQRITEATDCKTQAGAALATASWNDFIEGWLSKTDKSLVSSESLALTSATVAGIAPSTAAGGASSGVSVASAAPGGTPFKMPRLANTASPGGGGGSRGGATPVSTPLGKLPLKSICIFQQHIPCSADIVGDTLGVSGSPFCGKCKKGHHYFGECPVEWGKLRRPLPGFADDGTRIDKAWKDNEPLQRIVTLWTKFIQDNSNFGGNVAIPAGVPGAPTLADFQARIPGAPAKK